VKHEPQRLGWCGWLLGFAGSPPTYGAGSRVGWGEGMNPNVWYNKTTKNREDKMKYRRAKNEGGCYFFTLNLASRQHSLLVDEFDKLRNSFNQVKKRHPFRLDAMVILPEHLHAVITLPLNDKDYATRWMLIKSGFSRQIPKQERISDSRQRKGERGIWQRRYWEHQIRNDFDFARHVDYIHYNPVKHGYVEYAEEWPYSTIHEYIRQGILDKGWSGRIQIEEGGFGE
jgi:putative transposase